MTIAGWAGGPGLSTFYFTGASLGAEGVPEATESVARVQAYLNLAKPLIPTSVTCNVLGVVDQLDPATGLLAGGFSVTPPAGTPGTGTGSLASVSNAILGQLNSNVIISGRRVKGRTFVSPVVVGAVGSGGDPTSLSITTLNAALVKLGTTIVTPVTNVVWHRPKLGAGGAACGVNGYSTWSKAAVIRSRRD